jgi:uncharacterized protein (TIGR00251 family)
LPKSGKIITLIMREKSVANDKFQLKSTNELLIELYIQPGAKVSQIVGCHDGRLKIKISSPPVDGKANQEVVDFFAKLFNIARRDVELISGEKSRNKRVLLKGDALYFMNTLQKLIT